MKRLALAGIVVFGVAQASFGVQYTHQGISLVYDVEGPTSIGGTLRHLIEECEVEGCSEHEVEEAGELIKEDGGTINELRLR